MHILTLTPAHGLCDSNRLDPDRGACMSKGWVASRVVSPVGMCADGE